MPYQIGDKIVVLDIAANRQHARMRPLIGQEVVVRDVQDRHEQNARDGKGLQNIKLVGDMQGNYNDYRFVPLAIAPAIGEAMPAPQIEAHRFHVGQLVYTDNYEWRVLGNHPQNRIEVEVVRVIGRPWGQPWHIGHKGRHGAQQFRAEHAGFAALDDGPAVALQGGAVEVAIPAPNAIINPGPKFAVGDLVRLLNGRGIPGAVGWGGAEGWLDGDEMGRDVGKIGEVSVVRDVGGKFYYHLVANRWHWNEEWLEAVVPVAQRLEWKVGDEFFLIGDKRIDRDRNGPGWVDGAFDVLAEDKTILTISAVDWDNEWVMAIVDGDRDYYFDMKWIAKPVKELAVGDEVWYREHTLEGHLSFIALEKRPVYAILEIEGDRFRIETKNARGDADIGFFDKALWIRKGDEGVAAKKKEAPKLDPVKQKEKIDKLLAEWTDKFAAGAGGCANFILIKEKKNGELNVIGGTRQPCHYELRGGYDGGGGKPVAVMDSIHRRQEALPEFRKQGFKDYVSYLLNRSPWADSYLTKDFDEANTKGIMMNLDVSANRLVGACIAMRQSSEFSSVLPVHAFLKAKRFSGDVCFLIGQHYTMKDDGSFLPSVLGSGHTIMNGDMESNAVFKFFATKEFVGEDKKKPYRESQAYSNIFGTITGKEEYARAKAGEVSIEEWMRKNCVSEEVGEGLKKKQVVTEASILKLARAVKAELAKHKAKEEVAA